MIKPCVHFIGFAYHQVDAAGHIQNAIRVFGKPDFMHRVWDGRAREDIAPGDTLVFGNATDWALYQTGKVRAFTFDDSAIFCEIDPATVQ